MINLNGTTTGYGANTAELANADIRIGNGAAPTNGIYSPAANQLALSTAGTGRLFVDASGNVGIGTSAPTTNLSVAASTNATLRLSGNATSYGELIFSSLGSGWDAYGASIEGTGQSTGVDIGCLIFKTSPGGVGNTRTERLRIDSTGKVGIGTSAPSNLLDVSVTSNTAYTTTDQTNTFIQVSNPSSSSANIYGGIKFRIGGAVIGGGPGSACIYGLRENGTLDSPATALTFGTTNASATYGERLRLTSDGKVGIGTSSPGSPLTIESSAGNQVKITYPSIVSYFLNATSGGDFAINKDGTERLRIDSSGRLLVGTSSSSAAAKLVVQGITTDGNALGLAQLQLGTTSPADGTTLGRLDFSDSAGTQGAWISCERDGGTWTSGSSSPGRLAFSTTVNGAATPTEAMRINSQRELLIGTTTRTANGGVLQVSNGITFPGTQSACSDPNTLDDYEEGTWTPIINGSSTAGTGTYSVQSGAYTKIGNRVIAHARITWSAHTGTGSILITGLPFSSNATANTECAFSLWYSDLTYPASSTVTATSVPASTIIALYSVASGATFSNLAFDTAATIIISGAYFV